MEELMNHLNHRLVLGALTALLFLAAPGCNRTGENREIKDLSQKAAELEKLSQQASATKVEESRKLAQAGVNDAAPDVNTLQLTDAQRAALEERIKAEKNSSYQALLQEVLDKDQEIKGINQKIAQLRASLPRPEIAKENDSHYGMAMRFLRRKGVSEEKAKQLISKVLIMDQVAPGFEVYHFYSNGVYGSWVSQGKADISPTQLQAGQRAKLEGERDAANQESQHLQAQITDMSAEAEKLAADIDALRTEKVRMTKELDSLNAANQAQTAMLNSVHYLVGTRKSLVRDGVIVVPVFARDRAGRNWDDRAFTQSADLRSADSITLTAAEAGLQKIGKVDVVPGSLEKDKHYSLEINPDRTSAKVNFLDKERFRNEKVAFALAE
jgi:predicted  nucleic acid-binding Zn-ribbon protein